MSCPQRTQNRKICCRSQVTQTGGGAGKSENQASKGWQWSNLAAHSLKRQLAPSQPACPHGRHPGTGPSASSVPGCSSSIPVSFPGKHLALFLSMFLSLSGRPSPGKRAWKSLPAPLFSSQQPQHQDSQGFPKAQQKPQMWTWGLSFLLPKKAEEKMLIDWVWITYTSKQTQRFFPPTTNKFLRAKSGVGLLPHTYLFSALVFYFIVFYINILQGNLHREDSRDWEEDGRRD